MAAALSWLSQLPRRFLIALVLAYRLLLKAWIGSACRFEPSCSAYALQALERHGAARGSLLSAGRLLRCHPYCAGGCDPVPENFKNSVAALFSRLGLRQAGRPSPRHTDCSPIRNRP